MRTGTAEEWLVRYHPRETNFRIRFGCIRIAKGCRAVEPQGSCQEQPIIQPNDFFAISTELDGLDPLSRHRLRRGRCDVGASGSQVRTSRAQCVQVDIAVVAAERSAEAPGSRMRARRQTHVRITVRVVSTIV